MDMVRIFGFPAALLIIAVVANRLSRWTRVPDIIVLLLLGVGLGPILKWVNPENFEHLTRILGMLALILILFEGGLELRLKEAIRYSPGGLLLAIVSYGTTVALVASVARFALHLAWMDAAVLGSVLGSTSAAVVLPVIHQMDAPEPIKVTLTLESSLGEILAVLTVGTLIGLQSNDPLVEGLITGFGHHILVDVALGIGAGIAWSRIWPLVADQQFSNALNLGIVLGVFALGRFAGGSGLLAELVFGLDHFLFYCRPLRASLNQAWALSGVMHGRASVIACSSVSLVRALAARSSCLSFAQAFSIGFRSGE